MLLSDIAWGGAGLGIAVPDRASPVRTLRPRPWAAAQKLDWGRQALLQAARWLPDREIIAVADSGYAAIDLLNAVRGYVSVITRLRLDARLFDPPAPRRRGAIGRPRVIGCRQPTLAARLTNPRTHWRRLTVTGWYGRGERQVEIVSATALWPHPGRLAPIRYVLVRDVEGEFKPQAFFMHKPCGGPNRHPALVCPPLVDRGDLRRGPPPPRRRNPASMVGRRHRSHDTRAARAVFVDHAMGARTLGEVRTQPARRKLVSKIPANLQRRDRRGTPRNLALQPFANVRVHIRPAENTLVHVQRVDERRLLRRMNGQSRA
jgi:hypothetical protein